MSRALAVNTAVIDPHSGQVVRYSAGDVPAEQHLPLLTNPKLWPVDQPAATPTPPGSPPAGRPVAAKSRGKAAADDTR